MRESWIIMQLRQWTIPKFEVYKLDHLQGDDLPWPPVSTRSLVNAWWQWVYHITETARPGPSPQFLPVPGGCFRRLRAPHAWQSSQTGPLAQTCCRQRLVTKGTSNPQRWRVWNTNNQVFKGKSYVIKSSILPGVTFHRGRLKPEIELETAASTV